MYRQRIKIFLAVIGLTLAGLTAKLVDLQIIHGQDYRRAFERNLITTTELPTIRGRILDRNGRVLAEDKQCYDFCLDYRLMAERDGSPTAPPVPADVNVPRLPDARWTKQRIQAIRKAEGLSAAKAEEAFWRRAERSWTLARELCRQKHVDLDAQVDRILTRVQTIRESVGESVTLEKIGHAIVQVEETSETAETEGASFEPSLERWYPCGDLACHVIGLTGPVRTQDMNLLNYTPQEADRLARVFNNYLAGDQIGQSGVERMMEKELRGRRGYQRTRRGGEVVESVAPERGADVTLTIDAELQDFLARLFFDGVKQGSAVVISVKTGEVLALVSVPTYDMNRFREDYDALAKNQVDLPLIHRAIARRYPPGSTAKVTAALAGLASGLSPATRFFCQGALYPEDREHFKCASHIGHGSLELVEAIQHSCNVYFYNVGRTVGARKLHDCMSRFGYGSPTGIGLPEESGGNLPDHATYPADPMMWAIGQGAFDATPLQVANAMAAIARGEYYSPVLVKGATPATRRDLGVRRDYLDAVHKGMWAVVNLPGGTGYKVFRAEMTPGERFPVTCGKTGTADCEPLRKDINGDGRITLDEKVKEGNMAWFAGYASYTDPEIAFAVVVEYVPGHGGEEAGPFARKLVKYCQERGFVGR